MPQAVPPQPAFDTPLATDQITAALAIPVTCALNCNWLGDAPDGARNAYGGVIVTLKTATDAEPLFDESALLVAASATGFGDGTTAGAR